MGQPTLRQQRGFDELALIVGYGRSRTTASNLYWEAWTHGELMAPGGDCLPVGLRLGDSRRGWQRGAYELMYPHTVGGYIGDDDLDEGLYGRDLYASYYGDHFRGFRRSSESTPRTTSSTTP
nr:hypothetical protein [Nocardia transvalensis]